MLVLNVGLTVVHTVGHHRLTEWAADGDGVRAGGQSLVRTVQVDALAQILFHPHAGTTGTTAEASIAVALHLHQVGAGSADQLTRSLEDLVVAAQEARIVVGDLAAVLRCRYWLQATLADQLVQQLGVVDYLVVTAQLRVLVAQGVEAVCTGHNDLALLRRYALEGVVQDLDVLLCQHLEEELVTGAAGGVTSTALALAQHGVLHAGGVQQVGNSAGGLHRVVVVHACTANPEQVLGVVEVLDVLTEDRHLDAVFLGLLDPVGALVVVLAPRVALGLQVLEQATQLGREVRLNQHLVAAHVDNVVDVLDVHRALFHTGTTVGAGPQHVGVDNTHLARSNQLQQRHVRVGVNRRIVQHGSVGSLAGEHATCVGLVLTCGLQVRRGLDGVVAQVGDQQLRAQRLRGVPSRALLLAAATLGTRGEVHPALPGEVVDLANADRVFLRVCVFHGQHAATGGQRLRCTQCVTAVGVALQEDVEERHEAVPGNAPLDVHTDDEQPDHAGQQLDQREDGNQQRGFRQDLGQLHGEEVGGRVAALVAGEGGDLGCLHEDHAQALDQHDGLNEVSRAGVGAVEAGLLVLVADLLANDNQRDNTDDGAQAQQLVHEVVNGPVTDDGPAAFGVEDLNVGLEPHHGSQQEADHDEPVGDCHAWLLGHLGVTDDLLDQVHQSAGGVICPLQCRLAQSDRGKDLRRAADEEHPGGEG